MSIAFVYVSADNGVTWTPWDGAGGGGGGGNVTVVSWTAPETVSVGVVGGSLGLLAGAAHVGSVSLDAGVANIGAVAIQAAQTIGLAAGAANIGAVAIQAAQTIGLLAGTQNIGSVGLRALDGAAALENLRSSALGNLGGLNASVPGPGLLTNRPGDWSEFSDPGAATLATVTRLAAPAGKAHVITGIMANCLAVNAQTGLTVQLSDSSGVRGSWKFPLPATGQGRDLTITGLNIVMTTASSAVCAFNAAPAAGNFESITMTGYTL